MDEAALETIVMQLIVESGNARSLAIEAIRAARKGDFADAEARLKQAEDALAATHEVQAGLLQQEMGGTPVPVGLIMIHAQDHLMNAMTVKDLAVEIIEMRKTEKSGGA